MNENDKDIIVNSLINIWEDLTGAQVTNVESKFISESWNYIDVWFSSKKPSLIEFKTKNGRYILSSVTIDGKTIKQIKSF